MADRADRVYWQVLVVRCQVGDRAAFSDLVRLFQPGLLAFLKKLLRGRQSADDVSQEVWLDVFQGLPRLAEPTAFVAWFYRIAHHRAFRALRRRREAIGSIDDVEIAGDANETAFSVEEAQLVHSAMDELSVEHREVLLLRFMEDLSYEEIAAVLGCAVGTVRSRLHNAKVFLRRILERMKHP